MDSGADQLCELLAEFRLEADCVSAARCWWNSAKPTSADAAQIVERLEAIDGLMQSIRFDVQDAEGLRRLLLALVADLRVLIIVLAARLVQLQRAVQTRSSSVDELALGVSRLFAPLANRLGIWQLKWRLEDTAMRVQDPETYHWIAGQLAERRADREASVHDAVVRIEQALAGEGIEADVSGRPKHIFSIWRKMQRKQLSIDRIFDLKAVRVIVPTTAMCYASLGVVHDLWRPIPEEFDDYIANPKPNGYRSLHTAVFGPEGGPLEVQIRTRDMHEHAEFGVAAHWSYKEGESADSAYGRRLAQLRAALEKDRPDDLLETIAGDDSHERIYVLTPRGDVVELPEGATVLDFAYHIHTDVGHRCRGAKVGGRIVPLSHVLDSGDRVEILTRKEPAPSRDWLHTLVSSRARSKVRRWFNEADADRNIAAGREEIDRELKRLSLGKRALVELVSHFETRDESHLYEAVGRGEITEGQLSAAFERLVRAPEREVEVPVRAPAPVSRPALLVDGLDNMLTQVARCCAPVPGDEVVGYLTQRKGVSVHRADCRSLVRLLEQHPSRVLKVRWSGAGPDPSITTTVDVYAVDRARLVADIAQAAAVAKSTIADFHARVERRTGRAHVEIQLRVRNVAHLQQVLAKIETVPNVEIAKRRG